MIFFARWRFKNNYDVLVAFSAERGRGDQYERHGANIVVHAGTAYGSPITGRMEGTKKTGARRGDRPLQRDFHQIVMSR